MKEKTENPNNKIDKHFVGIKNIGKTNFKLESTFEISYVRGREHACLIVCRLE